MPEDPSLSPERTHALVVGIEDYGRGNSLQGPREDACAFAGWLLSRGVTPGNIRLFLSPPALTVPRPIDVAGEIEHLTHLVSDGALRIRAAEVKVLYEYLKQELRTVGANVLLLFWGGHGIVTAGSRITRKLYLSDFPFQFDLDSMLVFLRHSTEFGSRFRRQLCLIDSCAVRE